MPTDELQRAEAADDSAAIRDALTAAVRAANDRLWVHRNAARIYREKLGDLAAARGVLEELAPLTGTEWRLTAAAWMEIGDRDRAASCLEKAADNARTPTDLCTVALGYRESGFADEGRLLVDGADTIATRALDCWTVANVLRAFDAPALRVLERGLSDATDVVEIITFAHALATFGVDHDTLESTLSRAARRASTVEGWLALALAYDQLLGDRQAAITCVVSASKLSISTQHERSIGLMRARLGQLELLDDDRPKIQPHQLLRPGARTFGFERDAGKLLGWLRARIPRTAIDALSQPGMFMFNDDLVTLLEIQKSGAIPHPLPGFLDNLREVRWGVGPGVDPLTRAFACTLLLLDDAAAAQPGGHEGTMAVLLEACLLLGPGAVEGAISLYAALADAYDATFSHTTLGYLTLFAELGLAFAAAYLDPTDPRIESVIERLLRDEPGHRGHRAVRSERWLLGLAGSDEADRYGLWIDLASRTLRRSRHERLRERLVNPG